MEQTGEYRIQATRDVVWAGLNDPDILARCIDGCETMSRVADDRFDARVKARVGPVRATFTAELTLADIVPPERYIIQANVKGGPAGFARGSAAVDLAEDGDGTLLGYRVDAQVGGKLAQVGSRLIDGAARKMADDFFAAFRREVGEPDTQPPPPGAAAIEPEPATAAAPREGSGRWVIWTAAFVALLLALVFAL